MDGTIDIHYMLGAPTHCESCGKPIRRGQRAVTDGQHEFCTMNCEGTYDHSQPANG